MTYRITGQSGLIDTDSLVTNTMKPYKLKVSSKQQEQQILEWKQSQYRTIMKSSSDFYNKYLTVDGASSLLSSKVYNSIKFTSSDDSKVTATSTSGASMDNYTIKVKTLAANATGTIADSVGVTGDPQTITIGTGTGASNITFSKGATGSATVANYNTAVAARKTTLNNIATASRTTDQQTELDYLNKNVINAQYNSINKGVVFTAAKAETGGFTLNGDLKVDQNLEAEITNSKGNTYQINSASNKSYSNQVTVDGVSFNFNALTTVASTSNLLDVQDVTALTDSSLTDVPIDGTTTTAADGSKTTTAADGTQTTTKYTSGTIVTTNVDGRKTVTSSDGSKTTTALDGTITTTSSDGKTITSPDGRKSIISGGTTTTTATDGRKTIISGGTTTTTSSDGRATVSDGTKITTTSADGTTTTVTTVATGVKATTVASTVKLTSSTDVTALKDRIKSFINDYDTLLSSINTRIYETRDKNYLPLTDDQKKDMKDTDITNWQNKAQTGLLRNDSDLKDIASGLKNVMTGIFGSSVVSSSGFTLEKIGIKPAEDYKEKNGMYTVADEDKLTKALQNNLDAVKDMFTKNSTATDVSNSGIIPRLKDLIDNNLNGSKSVLGKKVGTEEYNTYNSDMSKQISDMKKKIVEMNTALNEREQNLYTKYSKLESALSKMQSQQSTLSSYFNTGSN